MNIFKKIIWCIGFIFSGNLISCQSAIFIEIGAVPLNTPENDTLFLATSLNGWQPNAPEYAFRKDENGNYRIVLENVKTSFEYKITRGNWDKVESTVNGETIENRKGSHQEKYINIEVDGWNDLFEKKSTRLSNVKVVNNAFECPQLNTTRRVWIYLPTDYENSTERYPVLYMHDGQNLFDVLTAFSGEWGVDETMAKLEKEGKLKLIIIGIENGGSERINDYTPWKNTKYGGGNGAAYGQFIVETLKPFIDENYRTKPDRENTGIMGSSLGGLVSMYIGTEYSEVFGRLGIFSPSFWWSKESLNQVNNKGFVVDSKIYMNAGLDEHKSITKGTNDMEKLLKKVGYTEAQLLTKYIEGGTHTERFWQSEFENAVLWLFK